MRIPRAGAPGVTPTTKSSNVEDSAEDQIRLGKQIEATGQNLQAAADQFHKADVLRQSYDAEAKSNRAFIQLKEKLATTTDLDNAESDASSEIAKIKSTLGRKIKDKTARERFNAEFDMNADKHLYDIRNELRTRKLNALEFQANQLIDGSKEGYYASQDDREKGIYIAEIKKKIGDLVNVKAMTPQQGATKIKEFERELRVGQPLHDAQYDPQSVMAELQKGEAGKYQGLKPTERLAIEDRVNRMVKAQREQIKAKLDENVVGAATMLVNRELTPDKLQDMVLNGDMTPDTAAKFEAAVFNPDSWKAYRADPRLQMSDKGKFFVDAVNSVQDDKSAGDILLKAVDAYNRGKETGIDSTDFAWVLNAVQMKMQPEKQGMWKKFQRWVPSVARNFGYTGALEYMKSWDFQTDPDEHYKEFTRTALAGPVGFNQTPRFLVNAFGLMRQVFDGGLMGDEEKDAKPKSDDSGTKSK